MRGSPPRRRAAPPGNAARRGVRPGIHASDGHHSRRPTAPLACPRAFGAPGPPHECRGERASTPGRHRPSRSGAVTGSTVQCGSTLRSSQTKKRGSGYFSPKYSRLGRIWPIFGTSGTDPRPPRPTARRETAPPRPGDAGDDPGPVRGRARAARGPRIIFSRPPILRSAPPRAIVGVGPPPRAGILRPRGARLRPPEVAMS